MDQKLEAVYAGAKDEESVAAVQAETAVGVIRILEHPTYKGGNAEVAFSRDGRSMFVNDGEAIVVRDVETGRDIRRLEPPERYQTRRMSSMRLSADGLTLSARNPEMNYALRWNADTGQFIGPVEWSVENEGGEAARWRHLPRSKETDPILTAAITASDRVSIWSLPTYKGQRELVHPGRMVRAFDFTPDGRRVVTTSSDANGKGTTITVWSVATGRAKYSMGLFRPAGFPTSMAVHPDGRRLLIGMNLGNAVLMNLHEDEPDDPSETPLPVPSDPEAPRAPKAGLAAMKDALKERFFRVPGVAGVGLRESDASFIVFFESEAERAAAAAKGLLEKVIGGHRVLYWVEPSSARTAAWDGKKPSEAMLPAEVVAEAERHALTQSIVKRRTLIESKLWGPLLLLLLAIAASGATGENGFAFAAMGYFLFRLGPAVQHTIDAAQRLLDGPEPPSAVPDPVALPELPPSEK